MADQQEKCGCDPKCKATKVHTCDKPCIWPNCLTREEAGALVRRMDEMEKGIQRLKREENSGN